MLQNIIDFLSKFIIKNQAVLSSIFKIIQIENHFNILNNNIAILEKKCINIIFIVEASVVYFYGKTNS